jgi:recombination protein RecT
MNANNRLAPQAKKMSFSQVITSDSMQKMIAKSVSDPRAAARFTATLISVVNSSQQLKECEPQSIVAAALRGEGYGLILGHGYGVVPYGSVATFILQYKGMIQLAMSTGFYEDIDCKEVREGEYKGRDRRTGRVTVDFSTYETDEEREQHPIIGYYAYFELKDGYFRAEYMSVDALLKHADHYSPAFSLETYNKFMAGELDEKETAKLKKSSPWYDVSGGQDAMFKKTVLRRILNSGYAPLANEVRSIISVDDEKGVIPDLPVVDVDRETGEVIDTPKLSASAQDDDFFDNANAVEEEIKKRQKAKKETVKTEKETKPKMKTEVPIEDFADDGFFGDDMT